MVHLVEFNGNTNEETFFLVYFPRYIPIKRPVEVVVGKVAIPDKGEVSLVSAISRNGEKVEVEKPRMRPNTEKPICFTLVSSGTE